MDTYYGGRSSCPGRLFLFRVLVSRVEDVLITTK